MRIAVFGLGYVGTVTAAGLASQGHDVCGVDIDAMKVGLIREGRSPVVEPGLDELVRDGVTGGRLRATTDAASALDLADVSLLCVGTPSTPRGSTDLRHLSSAIQDIRAALPVARPSASGLHTVVVRSTVPPGTGDELVAPTFADLPRTTGWTVATAMCPEFLREGSGVADFFDPPFVVVGTADERALQALTQTFAFLDRDLHEVDVRSAEALKYACNAFHATKVSFANEMGRILRVYGVDSRKVMQIFCEDRSLNISPAYLRPGFAFGGSCLPKDLRSLLHMARSNDLDVPLLAGSLRSNEVVVRDVLDRLIATNARSVALLGLSFKMATDDLRESPYVELAEQLIGKGFDMRIYDPIVNPDRLTGANLRYVQARLPHLSGLLASSPQEALANSDVALVATSDAAVVEALCTVPPRHIVDLSGRLGAKVEELDGYEGLAWTA